MHAPDHFRTFLCLGCSGQPAAVSVAPNAVPVFWMWSQKKHGRGPRRGQRPRATCGGSAGCRGVVRPASVAAVAAAAPTVRGRSTWRRFVRIIASPPRRRLYSHPQQLPMLLPIWKNGKCPEGCPKHVCRAERPLRWAAATRAARLASLGPVSAKWRGVYTKKSLKRILACNLRSHVSSCTSHLP